MLRTVSESRIGSRPLRLRVGDHLAEVPAEGVYDLMLLGEEVVDLLGLVAEPGERAARAGARR